MPTPQATDSIRNCLIALFLTITGVLTTGCAGSLFKVKPTIQAPPQDVAKQTDSSTVNVRAVPLLSDEENQALFEANLPLNGILPVHVEITNKTGTSIPLEKVIFKLHDAGQGQWKYLTVKQTASRIIKANGITLFNPASRSAFIDAMATHTLETKTALAPNERRQGLVFFRTPKNEPVESPRGLLLSIERLPEPLQIQLN
jgi:hypothetical protein